MLIIINNNDVIGICFNSLKFCFNYVKLFEFPENLYNIVVGIY